MNVNCKVSLTDEQRRKIHINFYDGKKGMISRNDVNTICQAAITDWLIGRNNGPAVEEVIEPIDIDPENIDIGEVLKQNALLITRNNILQHALDTRK